jgi:hypothetical protein
MEVLMSEISERPEQAESHEEKSIERKSVLRDFRALRQSVTTLKTNWETLVERLNTEIQRQATQIYDLEEGIGFYRGALLGIILCSPVWILVLLVVL